MDLLTDLLHQAGLQRRLLDLTDLGDAAALRFPCGKSIGLHVVTRGRVFVHAPTLDAPLELAPGDIALMARGCDHLLSTRADLAGQPVETIAPVRLNGGAMAERAGAGLGAAPAPQLDGGPRVISGAYQLWNTPVHPFFGQLPPWFVVRAAEVPRLAPLALAVGLLEGEASSPGLGSDTALDALLDLVFTHLLRAVVERQGLGGACWSQALRDPPVRQAVALLHADCALPWTLESLAAKVGLSRTALAERFRTATGDTPLAYLRTVRMQRAMQLLADTNDGLERIAERVGYQDAFSFSKVFKRTVGLPPKEFRRRDAADRQIAWRFGTAGA